MTAKELAEKLLKAPDCAVVITIGAAKRLEITKIALIGGEVVLMNEEKPQR